MVDNELKEGAAEKNMAEHGNLRAITQPIKSHSRLDEWNFRNLMQMTI